MFIRCCQPIEERKVRTRQQRPTCSLHQVIRQSRHQTQPAQSNHPPLFPSISLWHDLLRFQACIQRSWKLNLVGFALLHETLDSCRKTQEEGLDNCEGQVFGSRSLLGTYGLSSTFMIYFTISMYSRTLYLHNGHSRTLYSRLHI